MQKKRNKKVKEKKGSPKMRVDAKKTADIKKKTKKNYNVYTNQLPLNNFKWFERPCTTRC